MGSQPGPCCTMLLSLAPPQGGMRCHNFCQHAITMHAQAELGNASALLKLHCSFFSNLGQPSGLAASCCSGQGGALFKDMTNTRILQLCIQIQPLSMMFVFSGTDSLGSQPTTFGCSYI